MDQAVDRLISIYREVIGEAAAQTAFDSGEEARATSRYLRWLSPVLKDRHHAEARAVQAALRLDALQAETSRTAKDRRGLDARLAVQIEQIEALTRRAADRDDLEARLGALTAQIDILTRQTADRNALAARVAVLDQEVATLSRSAADREGLHTQVATQAQEIEALTRRAADLADVEGRLGQSIQRQRELEILLGKITEERDARQRQLDQVTASRAWRWIRRYGSFRERWLSLWRP